MPRTPKARIRPQLLTWARESASMSLEIAAHKERVSVERLASWEEGSDAPTLAQLRSLANIYKRPIAVFYLPEPPLDFQALRDFRRFDPSDPHGWSPELQIEMRRVQEQREILLELRQDLHEDPGTARFIDLNFDSDPEDGGTRLRDLLGIPLEEQLSWSGPYDALNGWIDALEQAGYLVQQTSGVALDDMRGFSISDDIAPVIVVNGSDTPNGRVFSLLHEAAHLQLRAGGVCDLHDRGSREADRVEVFCNAVAAAALMPMEPFLSDPQIGSRLGNSEWPEDAVSRAARRFSVSREALLRRLMTFDRVTRDYYQHMREQYIQEYRESRFQSTGFAPPAVVGVRDMGRPYVTTVLTAYDRRLITAADLSRHLGLRLKHMPRVRELARQR